ncbi:MAG TPA: tetratricopeptide repeat protein [Candidatus Acidoferrales bacterium]|nr:tetratricopeptide repeat protein [Candidatus Acidoferrales bacterium]
MNRESTSPFRLLSHPAAICLLLALATLAIYWPVKNYGFIVNYDDDDYFFNNPHILGGFTWANVQWAFTSGEALNWHPLTWFSLMLDAQLFGKGAEAPHVTNVLFHAGNSILLFILFLRWTSWSWCSAAAALLFAIHPAHVESVAWISERKDVLSGFFALLTLLCYTRAAEHCRGDTPIFTHRPALFYWLSLFFFAGGLMSKPMLVTLPFILLLVDFWPLQRFNSTSFMRLLLEKVPFLLLCAAQSVVTFFVQRQGGAMPPLSRFPLGMRIENAFISYARYLAKTFWPVNLASPYPSMHYWPAIWVVLAIALFVALCFAAVVLRNKFPCAFTGWFWFVGMLIPVIGLVQVGAQAMADRYLYLPIIGILLIVVWGLKEVCVRYKLPPPVIFACAILVFSVSALRARNQVATWQNNETLFRHALAVTGDNYFANLDLAQWYGRTGRTDESLHYYYEAARISPGDPADLYNAANAFAKLGRWDEAIDIYHRVLQVTPNDPDILNNLGFALAQKHELPEAAACFESVLKLKPNSVEAYNNLATIYFMQGRYQEAAQQYAAALQLTPNDPPILINLGDADLRLGQTNAAAQDYEQALHLQPNNPLARVRLQALGIRP